MFMTFLVLHKSRSHLHFVPWLWRVALHGTEIRIILRAANLLLWKTYFPIGKTYLLTIIPYTVPCIVYWVIAVPTGGVSKHSDLQDFHGSHSTTYSAGGIWVTKSNMLGQQKCSIWASLLSKTSCSSHPTNQGANLWIPSWQFKCRVMRHIHVVHLSLKASCLE